MQSLSSFIFMIKSIKKNTKNTIKNPTSFFEGSLTCKGNYTLRNHLKGSQALSGDYTQENHPEGSQTLAGDCDPLS
jgi:hypothetical protein